ncbi:hypothetical protein [Halopseudomonas xiamenensis]|uniref:hypothetical protein n=1 Tax=Halopseudomonas xiamenensis TaxID=157792 RepID=UPI00162ADB06|nr:hypothetical protein [Halopseudomonas xiamenensis]
MVIKKGASAPFLWLPILRWQRLCNALADAAGDSLVLRHYATEKPEKDCGRVALKGHDLYT